MAENQAKISQKERLKEITSSIETGIKNMFESDKYANYLSIFLSSVSVFG